MRLFGRFSNTVRHTLKSKGMNYDSTPFSKCKVEPYGITGHKTVTDAYCLLPQNILVEKLFVALYIWLIFACSIGLFYLLVSFFLFLIPPLRKNHLVQGDISRNQIDQVFDDLPFLKGYGYWFVLTYLYSNIPYSDFKSIVTSLASNRPIPAPEQIPPR